MKLIVGLGNPGPKYETTRHNIGFLAIDRLIDHFKALGPKTKSSGEIFEAQIKDEKVLFVKPQTFMNLSGTCVGPLFQFYKCTPSDLIVIYDEIDLKPFQIRIKTGGGSAGHNGIRSLEENLGHKNKEFHRVRLGVGRPPLLDSGAPACSPADWVLQNFTDSELKTLDPFLDRVSDAVELMVHGQVLDAMNRYNRKAEE